MTRLAPLPAGYAERVYAGLLGKAIGVYLGRPVEGWAYPDIADRFGEVDRFVAAELGLPLVVADDDLSGTLCFARAVPDALDDVDRRLVVETSSGPDLGAALFGATWLNYVIENRTILWWGGYGRSTEHTAYLNLRAGLRPPVTGSVDTNGATLAEQIGAQIFSDAFALLHPGDPERAAALTVAAASVSHGGVALECSAFFAALRAAAFDESDLPALIATGRQQVADRRLLQVIDEVGTAMSGLTDWRAGRDWVDRHHGYARYPGPCHSLANTALDLCALLLGGDDPRRSLMIAASAGFDTDSNAGTVGCLNGIRLGAAGLVPLADLRSAVADRLLIVSADGGECVTDLVRETHRLTDSAARLRGQAPPGHRPRFAFDLPGALQGWTLDQSDGVVTGAGGSGLHLFVPPGSDASIATPTFLADEADHFSTLASPTLYPGHTVEFELRADRPAEVRPYLRIRGGAVVAGDLHVVRPGTIQTLRWTVPELAGDLPERVGLRVRADPHSDQDDRADPLRISLHRVDWSGAPIGFAVTGVLQTSIWDTRPRALDAWVSSAQNFEADFGSTFSVSHPAELGVVTTGTRDWTDYAITSTMTLSLCTTAGLVLRARGHRRFLAAVFTRGDSTDGEPERLHIIEQHDADRTVLADVPFPTLLDRRTTMTFAAAGPELWVVIDGSVVARTTTSCLLGGGAGFLVERGAFAADAFTVHHPTHVAEAHSAVLKG